MAIAATASWRKLHERLKVQTRTLHDDLELAVDIEAEIASRPRYMAYLARLWGLHTAAEQALYEIDFTPLSFDYSSRRRSQLLETDLAHLGFSPDRLRLMPHPAAPKLQSLEAGLGCVYVVEGSALGARAILPQIESALGLNTQQGASFFAGLGDDGKLIWRACLKTIDDIPANSPKADRVVEAATATFQMFRTWLPDRTAATTPDAVPFT